MQFTVNKNNILKLNGGFIFVIVIFFALFLRTYKLDNRPMHTDEAVHAIKFGELLENGSYIYDPIEYHGPTLNYLTLISASLLGENTLKKITEFTLRMVPAVISLFLIVSLLLLNMKNNVGFILLTAFLLAISPVFQFYSRYYIQEVLLGTFTYSSILTFYKYFKTNNKFWLITSGVLSGLIFATKETSIIIFFAALFSLSILYFLHVDFRKQLSISFSNAALFLLTAIFVSILFYSSFFTNLNGINDSILTFTNYLSKASASHIHIYPWYYYLKLMLYTNNNLLFYSSIPLFIFLIIGLFFTFKQKQSNPGNYFIKFISIFSLTQAVVYSLIPYKTPWLVINFWVGFLFIAAYGSYQSYNSINRQKLKNVFVLLVTAVLLHNIYQLYITSFKYPYQLENPFTYSQPAPDIISISDKVNGVVKANPAADDVLINIIAKDNDYWPLPWYFRKLNNTAWNNYVPDDIYNFPIILSSPYFEEELTEKLYNTPPPGKKNLYIPLFDKYMEIRPGIEIRGYVQKDYYDFYLRKLITNKH